MEKGKKKGAKDTVNFELIASFNYSKKEKKKKKLSKSLTLNEIDRFTPVEN